MQSLYKLHLCVCGCVGGGGGGGGHLRIYVLSSYYIHVV